MKYTIPFLIAIIILLLFKQCQPDNEGKFNENKIDSLKQRIDALNGTQKQLKDTVIYKEKIVYKYRDRYHETRHDSLMPCEEKLIICDTLIQADSSLIKSLKDVIIIDSCIISTQSIVIKTDSVLIKQQKKQLRKQKILTITGYALSALVVVVSMFSLR